MPKFSIDEREFTASKIETIFVEEDFSIYSIGSVARESVVIRIKSNDKMFNAFLKEQLDKQVNFYKSNVTKPVSCQFALITNRFLLQKSYIFEVLYDDVGCANASVRGDYIIYRK